MRPSQKTDPQILSGWRNACSSAWSSEVFRARTRGLYLGGELEQITDALPESSQDADAQRLRSQHGLSQNATGKYASVAVEAERFRESRRCDRWSATTSMSSLLARGQESSLLMLSCPWKPRQLLQSPQPEDNPDWAWRRLEKERREGWLPRNVLVVEPGPGLSIPFLDVCSRA